MQESGVTASSDREGGVCREKLKIEEESLSGFASWSRFGYSSIHSKFLAHCLMDGKGRAPVGQCAPKGDWHSWELLNLLIQHCPDGVVQVVSTRGVAVSITGCRLKTRLPRIFFYRQPSRQASTPCPHPHAETAELSDVVFSKAKRFRN